MNTYKVYIQKIRDGAKSPAPVGQSKLKSKIELSPPRTLALLGGDARMLSLAKSLRQAGHTVRLFACPSGNTAASLEEAITGANAVILPIPACREGEWLNAPGGDADIPKISLPKTLLPALLSYAPGAQILCGMPSDSLREAAESAGIPLYDYGADEAFVQENALLTAEGLIPLLEQHLASPVDASAGPAVVAGYGRVGKAVADALAARGVKVTILCRSAEAMQEAGDRGYDLLSFGELYEKEDSRRLAGAALLLNTVPAPVFDAAALRSFRGLYVELASGKGGRSEDAAAGMPPTSFLALPGIPGKVLPEKAGETIGRAVLRRLTHLQGKEVSEQC